MVTLGLADGMDLHDVWMLQPRHGERFAPKAIDVPAFERKPGAQHLQRDHSVQVDLLGEVYGGHAAAPDLALDTEAIQHHARPQYERTPRRRRHPGPDHAEAPLECGSLPLGNARQKRRGIGGRVDLHTVGVLGDDAVEQVVEPVVRRVIGRVVGHEPNERRSARDSSHEVEKRVSANSCG